MQLNWNRFRWRRGGMWLLVTAVSYLFIGLLYQPTATALPDADPVRRINVQEFSNAAGEEWTKTSIFWFGKAEYPGQGQNYVDVRVGYTQNYFLVQVLVIDYYLWLKTNPQPTDDLTQYDAVAIYLDTAYDRATLPQSDDYQFLVGAYNGGDYNPYQRDARGTGAGWNNSWDATGWHSAVGLDYSTGGPNTNGGNIDYGWTARFVIPWGDLGMSGPPTEGTQWGLGTRLYDRDDQPPAGAIPVESWPETFQPNNPSTWAELHFGADAYDPGPGTVQGTTLIRASSPTDNTVEDAWMGGGGLCASGHEGGTEVNHGDDPDLFTGNEIRPTHFPCYNKSFLRFDLSAVPPGKRILAAELTLHLDGNAGETPDLAQPSWVSLFSIKDPWQEMTIHWNNAPLAYENIDAIWVYPYSGDRDNPVPPGDPYTWNATKAVAEAYTDGEAVNLALYASDTPQHSSKYFHSSEVGTAVSTDPMTPARPTLVVTWGSAGGTITKHVSTTAPQTGDPVTYSLTIVGSGEPLSLLDVLPAGLSTPTNLSAGLSFAAGQLTWSDTPALGQVVTLHYTVTVTAVSGIITNEAVLSQDTGPVSSTATLIVNGQQTFLPTVFR